MAALHRKNGSDCKCFTLQLEGVFGFTLINFCIVLVLNLRFFLLLLKLFSIISAPVAHDLEWKRVLSNGMRIYYPSILLQALAFVIMAFGRH